MEHDNLYNVTVKQSHTFTASRLCGAATVMYSYKELTQSPANGESMWNNLPSKTQDMDFDATMTFAYNNYTSTA
jgi:hypothetical protein